MLIMINWMCAMLLLDHFTSLEVGAMVDNSTAIGTILYSKIKSAKISTPNVVRYLEAHIELIKSRLEHRTT
jgi:hypothetical protein